MCLMDKIKKHTLKEICEKCQKEKAVQLLIYGTNGENSYSLCDECFMESLSIFFPWLEKKL